MFPWHEDLVCYRHCSCWTRKAYNNFQIAWFITGSQDIPGKLADTDHDQIDETFLLFVRLICTVYFKKHLAEFTLDIPRVLYMSLAQDGTDSVRQHKRFIEVIRESVE